MNIIALLIQCTFRDMIIIFDQILLPINETYTYFVNFLKNTSGLSKNHRESDVF